MYLQFNYFLYTFAKKDYGNKQNKKSNHKGNGRLC